MRLLPRTLVLALVMVLLGTSCATTAVETTSATTAEAAAPVEVAVPTGREALARAEGEPYALWFWGAH